MAEAEAIRKRERVIANSAKKRRKMSAKQIAIFGTSRQKAALRSRRSHPRSRSRPNKPKRAHSHRAKTNRPRARSRQNTGEIIGYTLANSGRKKGRTNSMAAKTKKRRRSNAGKGSHKHHAGYRPNMGRRRTKMNRGHSRRQHNPGMGEITNIVTNAVFVIAGALGSKLLAQMVLGANNVGLIGYTANAVAGGVMWFVTEKIMHNKEASHGVIAGTAVQIILRLINDYTPFGSYVSSLGMGDYMAQAFVTPQVLVDPYNSAQIRIPTAWMPPPPPPPPKTVTTSAAGAGVSGYGGGALYSGASALY